MALTYTPSPDLGRQCPDFTLPAVEGCTYSLGDFSDAKALVVMFLCNHCPYVKAVESRILTLARDLIPKGTKFVAICSNDDEKYTEDSFENIQKTWKEKSYPFPYLYDESQEVAKIFGAVCTPDFFVFDGNQKLTYRGRLDDSWKDPSQVKSEDLRLAIEALLNNLPVTTNQPPSMGCSIKWRT